MNLINYCPDGSGFGGILSGEKKHQRRGATTDAFQVSPVRLEKLSRGASNHNLNFMPNDHFFFLARKTETIDDDDEVGEALQGSKQPQSR